MLVHEGTYDGYNEGTNKCRFMRPSKRPGWWGPSGVDYYNIGLRAWRDPSGVEKQPHSSSMAAY